MAKNNKPAPVAPPPQEPSTPPAQPDPTQASPVDQPAPDGEGAGDEVIPAVEDKAKELEALPPGMVRAWVTLGPILMGDNARAVKGDMIVIAEADAAPIKHHLTFTPPTKETA